MIGLRAIIEKSAECESIRSFASPDSVDRELAERRKKIGRTFSLSMVYFSH